MATSIEATRPRSDADIPRWSAARLYLLISGIFLVVASLGGFAVDSTFPADAAAAHDTEAGHVLGIFETNGWHNLSGLISGLLALAFVPKPQWARAGAFFKGFLYVGVTASIVIWGPETFLIESNTADQVLHATLAITGLSAAVATPRTTPSNKS